MSALVSVCSLTTSMVILQSAMGLPPDSYLFLTCPKAMHWYTDDVRKPGPENLPRDCSYGVSDSPLANLLLIIALPFLAVFQFFTCNIYVQVPGHLLFFQIGKFLPRTGCVHCKDWSKSKMQVLLFKRKDPGNQNACCNIVSSRFMKFQWYRRLKRPALLTPVNTVNIPVWVEEI